ncbi:hypothetical protein HDU99_004614, partial [Rhizoclosmatium hyalinum]
MAAFEMIQRLDNPSQQSISTLTPAPAIPQPPAITRNLSLSRNYPATPINGGLSTTPYSPTRTLSTPLPKSPTPPPSPKSNTSKSSAVIAKALGLAQRNSSPNRSRQGSSPADSSPLSHSSHYKPLNHTDSTHSYSSSPLSPQSSYTRSKSQRSVLKPQPLMSPSDSFPPSVTQRPSTPPSQQRQALYLHSSSMNSNQSSSPPSPPVPTKFNRSQRSLLQREQEELEETRREKEEQEQAKKVELAKAFYFREAVHKSGKKKVSQGRLDSSDSETSTDLHIPPPAAAPRTLSTPSLSSQPKKSSLRSNLNRMTLGGSENRRGMSDSPDLSNQKPRSILPFPRSKSAQGKASMTPMAKMTRFVGLPR